MELLFGETNSWIIQFYIIIKVPIDEKGEFLIGLGRNHPKFGELKIITPNEQIN